MHTVTLSYTINVAKAQHTRFLVIVYTTNSCENTRIYIYIAAALPTHFGSVAPEGEHVAAERRLQLSFLEQVVLHHLRVGVGDGVSVGVGGRLWWCCCRVQKHQIVKPKRHAPGIGDGRGVVCGLVGVLVDGLVCFSSLRTGFPVVRSLATVGSCWLVRWSRGWWSIQSVTE